MGVTILRMVFPSLDTFPLNFLPLLPSSSAPATSTSRLFLEVGKETPASGLLHLLFPPPQVLFLQMATQLIKTLFSNTSPLKSHLIRILPFHSVQNHLQPLSCFPHCLPLSPYWTNFILHCNLPLSDIIYLFCRFYNLILPTRIEVPQRQGSLLSHSLLYSHCLYQFLNLVGTQ